VCACVCVMWQCSNPRKMRRPTPKRIKRTGKEPTPVQQPPQKLDSLFPVHNISLHIQWRCVCVVSVCCICVCVLSRRIVCFVSSLCRSPSKIRKLEYPEHTEIEASPSDRPTPYIYIILLFVPNTPRHYRPPFLALSKINELVILVMNL